LIYFIFEKETCHVLSPQGFGKYSTYLIKFMLW